MQHMITATTATVSTCQSRVYWVLSNDEQLLLKWRTKITSSEVNLLRNMINGAGTAFLYTLSESPLPGVLQEVLMTSTDDKVIKGTLSCIVDMLRSTNVLHARFSNGVFIYSLFSHLQSENLDKYSTYDL